MSDSSDSGSFDRARVLHHLRQFGTFVAGGIVLLLIQQLLLNSESDRRSQKFKHLTENSVLVSPPMPDSVSFAGEPVPIRQTDVYEDLEKHLLVNMYSRPAMTLILKRANRWRGQMLPILKENGVPEDFFYLMVAESGIRNVRSYRGAEGYWQFMKATGGEYGLEVNKYVDQRRDPIAATHAACKYLKRAYKRFGSWTLAAASYNMGMGGVRGAVRRQDVDSYYELYLNTETANYIYRILSFKLLMEHPAEYGFKLFPGDLYEPITARKVKVKKSIPNLVTFAKKHGTTYKLLKLMNPWLKNRKLPVSPGEEYTFLIVKPSEMHRPPLQDSTNSDRTGRAEAAPLPAGAEG